MPLNRRSLLSAIHSRVFFTSSGWGTWDPGAYCMARILGRWYAHRTSVKHFFSVCIFCCVLPGYKCMKQWPVCQIYTFENHKSLLSIDVGTIKQALKCYWLTCLAEEIYGHLTFHLWNTKPVPLSIWFRYGVWVWGGTGWIPPWLPWGFRWWDFFLDAHLSPFLLRLPIWQKYYDNCDIWMHFDMYTIFNLSGSLVASWNGTKCTGKQQCRVLIGVWKKIGTGKGKKQLVKKCDV